MHPDKDILERFVIGLTNDPAMESKINEHLTGCEFCREYCEQFRHFLDLIDQKDTFGSIIPLRLLDERPDQDRIYLAADGKGEEKIRNIATLYSENPEVVVRVMRDTQAGYDYAQIISDDPDLSANVMIHLPDIDREFIVDDSGLARLDGLEDIDLEKMKWQLKMPRAVFTVEPLAYDPDRIEESRDFVLETDNGDRLKVIIEDKTEGKQISLQVLALNGKTDFKDARVNILCKSLSLTKGSAPDEIVSFGPIDITDKIHIRIFT